MAFKKNVGRFVVFSLSLAVSGSGCVRPYVRPNIYSLDPSGAAIASLRNGVAQMQARAATDPTSWAYQAGMHGSYATAQPLWNGCHQGSYFFLAWHRMYLYYFERILRAASGDSHLALPYWNYSDDPSQSILPVAFRLPADSTNSLYVSERDPNINLGASLPASAVDYSNAFSYTNFFSPFGSGASFGGQQESSPIHFMGPHGELESTPHDVVHMVVGGDDGWMSDPNTAAQDPIFYLHHANIDRLWQKWICEGNQDPLSDSEWMNQQFSFFDENGHQVTLSGAQIVDSVGQLGYRYDDASCSAPVTVRTPLFIPRPIQLGDPALALATTAKAAPVELSEKIAEVSVPLSMAAAARIGETTAKRGGVVLLRVEGIEFPKVSGTYYEVYLDPTTTGVELTYKSPSYVGNLAFFGLKHNHGGQGPMAPVFQTLDLTRTIKRLVQAGAWRDDVATVRFVPRGVVPVGATTAANAPLRPGVRATFSGLTIETE